MIRNNKIINQNCPILLVEDNQDDIMLMERAFKKAGAKEPLNVVRDGAEAINFLSDLSKNCPAGTDNFSMLILLDLKLPKKSGLDVLKWIRSQPEINKIPVIVFTSSNQEKDINSSYKFHANTYIVKPISFQYLVDFAKTIMKYWFELSTLPVIRMRTI